MLFTIFMFFSYLILLSFFHFTNLFGKKYVKAYFKISLFFFIKPDNFF